MSLEPSDRARPAVRSTLLRSILLVALDRAWPSPLSVTDLVDEVHRLGFALRGRDGKAVSDALRTDLRLGRVRRVERGVYRRGQIPRTTAWRCRQRIRVALHGAAPAHWFGWTEAGEE